jgi:glycosyltransferase involved in cell wall biosynthesis
MDSSMADQLLEKWHWLASIRGILDWFEGLAVRNSKRVIAVCQALVDKAESYRPVTTVELLTDTVLEIERAEGESAENLRSMIPGGRKLMLYVGNLEHYQGVDLVIEAMPSVPDDIVFMVIGGIEEDIARCKVLSRNLGVEDRVMLIGPRPVSLLRDYLVQADWLISPRTKGVNTPMKVYSYLGAAVPVIATDIPSHTQVLNSQNACLVKPASTDIAAAINRLASDSVYATRIAEQAARDAEEKYSFSAYRNHLLNIYRALETPS